MITVELFSGTKSFSKVAKSLGYWTFTIDNDPSLQPDLCIDMLELQTIGYVDFMWASPPCQGFSVAVIGRNWNHDNTPKTDSARLGMELVQKTLSLIRQDKPKWWFIENPQGKLKKLPFMIEAMKEMGGVMHTIWYCRYGDNRAKPTNVWTNATWWKPREVCHNRRKTCPKGCSCEDHEAAPRGSRTGTQGRKGAKDRGRIPPALFEEILSQMPKKVIENGLYKIGKE